MTRTRAVAIIVCALLAVLAVTAGWGCGGSSDTADSLAPGTTALGPSEAELAAGRAVFLEYCARCHGESGEGGTGPKLLSVGRDPLLVQQQVRQGGILMPSFADELSGGQLAAVAAYVVSLGEQ
jgi:ubiquinol-cytochrome c reductase cytochrome c subunit